MSENEPVEDDSSWVENMLTWRSNICLHFFFLFLACFTSKIILISRVLRCCITMLYLIVWIAQGFGNFYFPPRTRCGLIKVCHGRCQFVTTAMATVVTLPACVRQHITGGLLGSLCDFANQSTEFCLRAMIIVNYYCHHNYVYLTIPI